MNELDKKRMRDVSVYLLEEYNKFQARKFEEYRDAVATNYNTQRPNISQTEFGKMLGLAQGEISWYMTGQRLPTIMQADSIAAVLGNKIYELCGYRTRVSLDDAILNDIIDNWPQLPEERRAEIARLATSQTGEEGDNGNSQNHDVMTQSAA